MGNIKWLQVFVGVVIGAVVAPKLRSLPVFNKLPSVG